jgi:hypothetical protein
MGFILRHNVNRDSSVGTVTRLTAGRLINPGLSPARSKKKIIYSPNPPDKPTQFPIP